MFVQNLQPLVLDEQNFLNLMVQNAGRLVVKVLDVRGMVAKTFQTMLNEENTECRIDVKDLPTGKYVLNAFNGDYFLKCIRFVKQ
jgi:hypothetical protein